MWKAIAMVGMLATLGCAARQAQVPRVPAPVVSTDWAAVQALPTQTEVLVTLDGNAVRQGLVVNVTEDSLAIRDIFRVNVSVLPRRQIARVTERTMISDGRDPWYVRVPITSAVLGGLGGTIVGAADKDKTVVRRSAWTWGVGMFVGTVWGLTHHPMPKYQSRLVFSRP
jgi:hypothetical protein